MLSRNSNSLNDMKEGVGNMNPRKVGIIAIGVVAIIAVLSLAGQVFETNNSGFYQIKQAALTGEMSVRTEAGTYYQGFADISTYQLSDTYYFSKHELDGGSGKEADPIKVRFNDGGTAQISGSIKYRLSINEKDQLSLHRDFKNYDAVKADLVRQVVTEAIMQTATLMKAEESYSTRRAEFAALAEEQIIDGIYETNSIVQKLKDADGNEFIEASTSIKRDANNKPVVRKQSSLLRYKIEVLQFVIKDIDFDDTIENLIAKKKEAEQQKVVARANAERAKQDAITAREQGEAKVAVAKAEKEVEKIQAVTDAQKAFEVAQLERKQAEEVAKAKLVEGEAQAKINNLKVKAGLTPQERAEYQMKTSIGVAAELAKISLPSTMVIGGDGKSGNALNPFDAVGLESFMRINEKMSNTKSLGKEE